MKKARYAIIAAITISCVVGYALYLPNTSNEPGIGRPRPISSAEWNALVAYARVGMGRTSIVNDTAVDFALGTYTSQYGIRPEGWHTSPDNPAAATVVDQYTVTFSRFVNGTVLSGYNAVLDVAHRCMIYLHDGAYIAQVIVEE